jgi:ABC-type multidrug transport system ATPase subunit
MFPAVVLTRNVLGILLLFYTIFGKICGSENPLNQSSFELRWSNLEVVSVGSTKKIVNIPEGSLRSGRFLGILGPSGSGKSTFLKLLANRLALNLRLKGKVSIVRSDGIIEDINNDKVAFVYQDDSFFDMLTVGETLQFAMQLRQIVTPNHHISEKASAIVDPTYLQEIINVMSLQKIVSAPIGGGGVSQEKSDQSRGISGGERKRLAVACELVGNPAILIADEPTSGLDAFQALQVVTTLRNLARQRNVLVIATIHQPRSLIFQLCDDLLLFTPRGHLAYAGSREDALSYFANIAGFTCPDNINPAEFLIDLVSYDYTSSEALQATKTRIGFLETTFQTYNTQNIHKSSNGMKKTSQEVDATSTNSNFADFTLKSNRYHPVLRGVRHLWRSSQKCFHSACISIQKTWLLYRRSLLQTLRDGKVNLVRVLVSVLLAMVISSVYQPSHLPPMVPTVAVTALLGESDPSIISPTSMTTTNDLIAADSISARVNIIAQGVINVSMLSMIKTLQLYKKERNVIERERCQGYYR